jgi:hypothetical protein
MVNTAIREEKLMSENTRTTANSTVNEVFKGETNEPHHMNDLTDSAINPGAVLKADGDIPTDQRFTVKKEFGASQVISTEREGGLSGIVQGSIDTDSSQTIYRSNDTANDQVIQSGPTVLGSGPVLQQASNSGSSQMLSSDGASVIQDSVVSSGIPSDTDPAPMTEAELRAQTISKVDKMLEEAKRRGDDMEAVMQKAEQLMNRVKSMSEAMKVDDALKERIRQIMLRTHQLRRRVTKSE